MVTDMPSRAVGRDLAIPLHLHINGRPAAATVS
jgi:hypothetical protein